MKIGTGPLSLSVESLIAMPGRFAGTGRLAFKAEYRHRLGQLDSEIRGHSGDTSSEFDCETLHITVRAARPSVVVETGVLFGAFSAHILEALSRCGAGTLVSFDMPERRGRNHLKDDRVPEAPRSARRLVLGDTRQTLPSELQRLERVTTFSRLRNGQCVSALFAGARDYRFSAFRNFGVARKASSPHLHE